MADFQRIQKGDAFDKGAACEPDGLPRFLASGDRSLSRLNVFFLSMFNAWPETRFKRNHLN